MNGKEEVILERKPTNLPYSKIFVDIAGAVEKPDVYEVTAGSRLKDVLIMAGGLSAQADRHFFARYFNLSRIISDQEKIYIPSTFEIENGIFTEEQLTFENFPKNPLNEPIEEKSKKININTSTIEELNQLPGVGKATAQKIINNRP